MHMQRSAAGRTLAALNRWADRSRAHKMNSQGRHNCQWQAGRQTSRTQAPHVRCGCRRREVEFASADPCTHARVEGVASRSARAAQISVAQRSGCGCGALRCEGSTRLNARHWQSGAAAGLTADNLPSNLPAAVADGAVARAIVQDRSGSQRRWAVRTIHPRTNAAGALQKVQVLVQVRSTVERLQR